MSRPQETPRVSVGPLRRRGTFPHPRRGDSSPRRAADAVSLTRPRERVASPRAQRADPATRRAGPLRSMTALFSTSLWIVPDCQPSTCNVHRRACHVLRCTRVALSVARVAPAVGRAPSSLTRRRNGARPCVDGSSRSVTGPRGSDAGRRPAMTGRHSRRAGPRPSVFLVPHVDSLHASACSRLLDASRRRVHGGTPVLSRVAPRVVSE